MISQDWTDVDCQSLSFLQLGTNPISSDTFCRSFLFFNLFFSRISYMHTMKYHIPAHFPLQLCQAFSFSIFSAKGGCLCSRAAAALMHLWTAVMGILNLSMSLRWENSVRNSVYIYVKNIAIFQHSRRLREYYISLAFDYLLENMSVKY